MNFRRFTLTFYGAHFCKSRCTSRRVAVFDPFIEVLRRQTAKICRDVWLSTAQLTEPKEVVSAKLVCFIFPRAIGRIFGPLRGVAPEVRSSWPFVFRPDSIAPIVTVSKTTTRPTNDTRLYFCEGVNKCFANAGYIWNS